MAKGDESNREKTTAQKILEQASQRTLSKPEKSTADDTLQRVFGKDKAKNFTVNETVETSTEIRARAIAEIESKYRDYFEAQRHHQESLETLFFKLSDYFADKNVKFIDRESLHSIFISLGMDFILGFKRTGLSVDEYYKTILDYVSKIHQEAVIIAEPEPADKKRTAPREDLNNRLANSTADVIAALEAGGKDAASVCEMFANAGRVVAPVEPEKIASELLHQPYAKILWVNRTDSDPDNAPEFIKKYYSDWLPYTLAQQELQDIDPELYVAYTSRTRKDRHPEEKITFAPKKPRSDKLDDAERGRRQLEQNNASKAKTRSHKFRNHGPQVA